MQPKRRLETPEAEERARKLRQRFEQVSEASGLRSRKGEAIWITISILLGLILFLWLVRLF